MQLNVKNLTNLLLLTASVFAWWFTATAIQPQLHYYLQQSAFLTDLSFFKAFVKYPGGIADYMAEFIAQFFYFNAFGSFLIILLAVVHGFIALNIIGRITERIRLRFSLFCLILLLSVIVQCNYYYPYYAGVRLLLSSLFIWVFTVIASKYPSRRYYISILLAVLLFHIAGGAALILYGISVILIQIHFYGKKSDVWALPLFAVFTGLMPYLSYKYIFLVDLPLVYDLTHSKSPEILHYAPDYKLYALYLILPIAIGLSILVRRFQLRAERTPQKSKPKKESIVKASTKKNIPPVKEAIVTPVVPHPRTPVYWLSGQVVVMAALAVFSLNHSLDKTTRNKLLVSYYASNAEWEKVMDTAKGTQEYDIFTNVEYNRALANTGKLTENLFSYSQLAGPSGLFVDGKVTSDIPFICCDQYYDLGFMHEAQHWAFEAQTIFPNSPRLLKRLVQINLVNRKYNLAQKFLHELDHNMLYHDWVNKYQKYIDDTTLVSKDADLSWKRKCEPVESFSATFAFPKLMKLLEANPANKMALDYLLCGTLMDGDLSSFMDLINKYPIYHTAPLPRTLEEAVVLYYYKARKTPGPGEVAFSKQRLEQFVTFVKAIRPYGQDWRMARNSLQKDYGTTYWYYLRCLDPKVTKAQIKRQ